MINYAIEIKNLSAGYDKTSPILESIDLNVKPGTFLGIIGPNGAGKTTLFKAILGIIPIFRGEIKVFGNNISKVRGLVGYVPQSLEIEPFLPVTVEELVSFGLITGLLNRISDLNLNKNKVFSVLSWLGISEISSSRYTHLSVGQKQRVLIARALVKEPKLLLLDEPTASIDEPTEENIFYLLRELNRKGMTIIMISHDIGVLSQFVDEIACLNRKLIYHGKGSEELGSALEQAYRCPVDVIAHGVPHRVFKRHKDVR